MSYQDPEHVDVEWRNEYWSDFRQHVHELVLYGYKAAKPQIKHKHDETDITGFIAQAIDDWLNSPDSPERYSNIDLREDHPVPGAGRTGRHRRRPDLIFVFVKKGPRPLYFFESKRLRQQKTHRENYYLGEEGLGRYISGAYARKFNEAGMLGYVQCDTVDQWVKRLRWAIDNDANCDNKLLLKPPQREIQVIDGIPNEWVSEHRRITGENISIYHILLDYCP